MAKKPTLIQRLRYGFDNTMAAGPAALIMWLLLATVFVIAVAAAILHFGGIGPEDGRPLQDSEAAWASLMRTLDAGNLAGDEGWGFRLIMLLVTLWGIFVVSSLIGILSTGVQQKLDELRKGRSIVLERGHTIILNWSASIFDIIDQIGLAQAKERRRCIVIMAAKDKVEMEDEIAAKLTLPRNIKVICRSGDPANLDDLEIVNLEQARSIIVVSPQDADPDSQTLKTIVALIHNPKRREAPYRIAAEFRHRANAGTAKDIAKKELQIVQADDLLSRITVQCSRQAGLSEIYSDLLSFEGNEIYTIPAPAALIGQTYGNALEYYERGALIGLSGPNGLSLNPPADILITHDHKIIVVAEDRRSIIPALPNGRLIEKAIVRETKPRPAAPERTLILGWNRRGAMIATELAAYMAPGSTLTIAADLPDLEQRTSGIKLPNANLSVFYVVADTGQLTTLESLEALTYDHVIVLGYTDAMATQAADTRTLITLLHLRHLSQRTDLRSNIVSEMADIRNRELADIAQADDFVISNKLVSLMLTQASENESAADIFADLLDEEGAEIYMRPIEDYVAIDRPVNFYTLVEPARRRSETAFGYLRKAASPADVDNAGIVLNPTKSDHVIFAKGDSLIVLASS